MVEPRLTAVHNPFAIDFATDESQCIHAAVSPDNFRQTQLQQSSPPACPPPSSASALTNDFGRLAASSHDERSLNAVTAPASSSHATSKTSSTRVPSLHIRQPSVADTVHQTSSHDYSVVQGRVHAATPPITIPAKSLHSTLSTKSMNSAYSKSPTSAISSPALAAMSEITPLPSPIFPDDSASQWRKDRARRHGSAGSLRSLIENSSVQDFSLGQQSNPASRSSSITKKRNPYSGLGLAAASENAGPRVSGIGQDKNHSRVHSLGQAPAEPMHTVRPRNSTLSSVTLSSGRSSVEIPSEQPLHREDYLAERRGFLHETPQKVPPQSHHASSLPTPPPSNRSVNDSDNDESFRDMSVDKTSAVVFAVDDAITHRTTTYRQVRPLGLGSFSKVVLATNQALPPNFHLDENAEPRLKVANLVAIKIVEHGSVVGQDEERMELSLKREVELMRSVNHPSLINLHQYCFTRGQALLVLGYCPGGDLFDLASSKPAQMTPQLVQRIFAELVSALRYLHTQNIVHRDIKLENVLVNLRPQEIFEIEDPISHPKSLVTITDLGLSRTMDPERPLLTTRCGSEAYAAPEIILGQPYDGRETDAWALGVVLFTLLEFRLPFDQLPSRPGYRVRSRGRMTHRIARNDWAWWKFGDDDGDWDDDRGRGWEGARDVVIGLLKKVNKGRLTLDQVAELPWVKQGIQVPGGIKRGYDE